MDADVTDSAGRTPAEPADTDTGVTGDNDAEPTAPGPNRPRHWLRWTALGTSVVVLAAAGAGWWFYTKLDGNITTDTTAAAELRTYEKERPTPIVLDAKNILLVGSDSRSGKGNDKYGRDDSGSQRSDTTMLLHLAADRQSATAVSIPRDLMVDIPSCRKQDGTRSTPQFAQFNWAFQFGGAACTIRTVEKLTGVRVDHHMVVDFSGFKGIVDAVDGVEVCLKEPVEDIQAQLRLPAGTQTLDGEQALGFVRARHGIGDGSDTQRMERQQRFLGALFKKVRSNGVLLNPTRLYPVLDAATKAITTDPGLDSLTDLYELARSMQSVPVDKVQFMTVPRQQYRADRNRDELVQPDAQRLFERLRDDEPVSVSASRPASGADGPRGTEGSSDGKPGGTDRESAGPGATAGPTPGDEPSATADVASGATAGPTATTGATPDPGPTFEGSNAAAGACE
ncbi:LCP family protein [Streptomyces sp. NPDC002018]|uniref:LCP family protein n=1 Tax=Streptomyces sp. NPDC002018 TaxID=3364629 RepID=UPI003695EFA6